MMTLILFVFPNSRFVSLQIYRMQGQYSVNATLTEENIIYHGSINEHNFDGSYGWYHA